MAGMLQEEHPFIKMYIFVLKIYLVYTFSWIDFLTKFNGTCFFGSIMDLIVRKCWKISKKGQKGCPKFTRFLVKNPGGKKMGVKWRFFTSQTDFALISRVFICCGCHFTWSSNMDMKMFRIYSPTSKNDWTKCFVSVEVNQNIFPEKKRFTSMLNKCFFQSLLGVGE